jgi:DNA helicase-2/ATP-dependent DNA helicase PcrA
LAFRYLETSDGSMPWFADLHIHSRYSRATSKQCDVPNLALWARRKGLRLVGTGDFTHPRWREELGRDLEPAEPGLFRPRDSVMAWVDGQLPPKLAGEVRFVLQVEIATIYKKGDRTRKVHHCVYMPDMEAAGRFVERLERVGNLHSDGRPILGLDSRDLLEITLEASDQALLIPAHIWTPWFAALGSRSGFDSIEECYGDLAEHIVAVETGLSSDPAMNWRVSSLDRFRLVSCSDAHSPSKLARNATIFDGALDWQGLRGALAGGPGYVGTVEFFPDEGKYHLDGHRKCGVRLEPARTRELNGLCPVCGKPLTVGVSHRVETLADRPAGGGHRPPTAGEVHSLVPLASILSEFMGVGETSKRVQRTYLELLSRLGPELPILMDCPLEDIAQRGSSLLVQAIERLREGKVFREGGYDGEYGRVRLFEDHELLQAQRGGLLFTPPVRPKPREVAEPERQPAPILEAPQAAPEPTVAPVGQRGILGALDAEQRAVAEIGSGPILVAAGPGSGKTRTLTHRIAWLIDERGAPPEGCLTITFTRRAAEELRERLVALLPARGTRVPVHTFHSLGLALLREHGPLLDLTEGFRVGDEAERLELARSMLGLSERRARGLLRELSLARRQGSLAELEATQPEVVRYQRVLAERAILDFDQLITLPVELLGEYPELKRALWSRWPWISVDEYQDIDQAQWRFIRQLVPPLDANLCAIGDPDQSIYGFRGSDPGFFERFPQDFPGARVLRLGRNYRSGRAIVEASVQVVTRSEPQLRPVEVVVERPERVVIHEAPTDKAEAEFVVHSIEKLLGGHSFFSLDSGRSVDGRSADLAFSDVAVLYRTEAQAEALVEAFARSGMPFQRRTHQPLAELPAVRDLCARLLADEASGPLVERLLAALEGCVGERGEARAALEHGVELLEPLARRCGDDLERFLSELALGLQQDSWDPRAERIALLTLHASKGVEFEVVFLLGLDDGVLPLRFGSTPLEGEALDEERRLLYVGMTRARQRLYLCRAEKRLWRGELRPMEPSPFLRDIREQLVERHASQAGGKPRDPGYEQLGLFGSR